jgi:glycosyltransferase involved in cell wall biosynthesis
MRILFCTHCTDLYGANRSLLSLIEGLRSRFKIECYVLVPKFGPLTDVLEDKGIQFFVYEYRGWVNDGSTKAQLKAPLRLIFNLIQAVRIYTGLRSYSFDIVHSNSSVIPIGFFLSIIFKKPHIWHIREFGEKDYQLKFDFNSIFLKLGLKKSQIVIAISKAIQYHIADEYNYNNSHLLYNGIFNEDTIEIREFEWTQDMVFGIVGFIAPFKGHEEALHAFSCAIKVNPKLKFKIIGEGQKEYLDKLKQICYEEGLVEHVEFIGFINSAQEIYKQIDILIMCSQNEALGRVTIEAMFYGVPVIGFMGGGTQELIIHEKTGLFYSNGSKDLCEQMLRLVDSKSFMESISINAKKFVEGNFTVEKYVNQFHQLLDKFSKN